MEKVWLAKYLHRHGEDLSAHRTREGALAQLAKWADEWVLDFESFCDPTPCIAMRERIADPARHEELISTWVEYTAVDEDMNIEELEINE